MVRGATRDTLPAGVRQDTRKHTRHVLRPDAEAVERYLAKPGDAAWRSFATSYRRLLADRFEADRAGFEALAALAREENVWLGCSCPTAKNPDVRRCHTMIALEFMAERFPDLEIVWPESVDRGADIGE